MGAVATTLDAGIYEVQNDYGKPIGSLTQMGTIRLGKRTDKRVPMIRDFVPLSDLADLVFGGWDMTMTYMLPLSVLGSWSDIPLI